MRLQQTPPIRHRQAYEISSGLAFIYREICLRRLRNISRREQQERRLSKSAIEKYGKGIT